MSSIGKTKATATYHEWQTDTLAAPNANNAAIEGDDATSATLSPTTRIGNRTQISQRTIQVSGTLEQVLKAGRKSEKAYQLAKASSELKRDMETILLSNQVMVTGSDSTARKLGGIQAWVGANGSFGTGGSAGANGTTARTAGTARAFAEDQLKEVVRECYSAGGTPSVLLVGPKQKQAASAFPGIAAQRFLADSAAPTTIVGAADVYVSDFGTISVVPTRFIDADVAFVLDPEYAAVAYLRPFQTNELAKTGDSEKTQLLVEYTLEVRNPNAHGIIADLS